MEKYSINAIRFLVANVDIMWAYVDNDLRRLLLTGFENSILKVSNLFLLPISYSLPYQA